MSEKLCKICGEVKSLDDFSEQMVCFHFSSLQPLWADENFRKGAKLVG